MNSQCQEPGCDRPTLVQGYPTSSQQMKPAALARTLGISRQCVEQMMHRDKHRARQRRYRAQKKAKAATA